MRCHTLHFGIERQRTPGLFEYVYLYITLCFHNNDRILHTIYIFFFFITGAEHIYSAIKIPILNYSLMCVTFRTHRLCVQI